MEQILSELSFNTNGEGFTNITNPLNSWISRNQISKGILVVSIKHTSCSLIVNENADPRVLEDLSAYMKALVPEISFLSLNGNQEKVSYKHSDEGADDMPAHIRTALTCSCLSLSINHSKLELGTWQAVYIWEHRYRPQARKVCLHMIGDINSKEIEKRMRNQAN